MFQLLLREKGLTRYRRMQATPDIMYKATQWTQSLQCNRHINHIFLKKKKQEEIIDSMKVLLMTNLFSHVFFFLHLLVI